LPFYRPLLLALYRPFTEGSRPVTLLTSPLKHQLLTSPLLPNFFTMTETIKSTGSIWEFGFDGMVSTSRRDRCPGFPRDLLCHVLAVQSAVQQIHSLGLAHNHLNPRNSMLNSEKMPDVVDFGSCQPFGGRLMSGGTPG
jgi:serine/threonine protein kinase